MPLVANAKLSRGAGEGSDLQPRPSPAKSIAARLQLYRARTRPNGASAGTARSSSSCAEPDAARRRARVRRPLAGLRQRICARGSRRRVRECHQVVRRAIAVDDISFSVDDGQLLLAARALGLRQVDDAAHDQRLRAWPDTRRGPHRRPGHGRRAAPTGARPTWCSSAGRCSRI